MNEDLTQNLPPRSFEERIFAELAAMRQDFTNQLAEVRQEFSTQLAEVRRESAEQFAAVRQELSEQREMIVHVHARVVSVETRLTSLEEKVEARLHDTRPMWEGVQARLAGIATGMKSLNRHFRTLAADSFGLRVRVDKLEGESV